MWHSNRPVTMTHWSYQTLCQVKVDNLKEQWGLSTEGSAKAPVQRWVSAGFKCFALVCEIFAESTALIVVVCPQQLEYIIAGTRLWNQE